MDLTLAIEVLKDEIKDRSASHLGNIKFYQDRIKDTEEKIREYQHKLEDEVKPFEIALAKLRELNTVCEKCNGIGLAKQYCEETDSFEDDLCPNCAGEGKNKLNEVKYDDNQDVCPFCHGKGMTEIPGPKNIHNAVFLTMCKNCGGVGGTIK